MCLSSGDSRVRDWLLLARSMQQQAEQLVTFTEPVDSRELHICEHCAPLRAVEGKAYRRLMELRSDMDSLEDVEMQKRRFNIGALYDESEADADTADTTDDAATPSSHSPPACMLVNAGQ